MKELGPCPICGRPMLEGASVDRHHWTPKSHGGTFTEPLHRICHHKLHTLFSERELASLYSSPETLRSHPQVRKFIAWVRRMHPEYIGTNHPPRRDRRHGPTTL